MYNRLTTATMYGSLMDSLSQSQRNIQNLQQQIASGNKYNKLSDNPSAISRSLSVQSAINANDRYQTNSVNGITMLRYADSALNNVLDAVQSIRSLVIQAGDGALTADQLEDINAQIEANKKIMIDNLNTKVAGQYLFGGTDTSTMPFVTMSDGSIKYQGNDERIKYALSESLLGDVSFTGSDIVPENEDSYFICSHFVDLDWTWQGREEKVQITVGNRTLSVFIPEDWRDYDHDLTNKYPDNDTNAKLVNYSDDNGYRDPDELTGISLQDLADIVNSALEEQGADMLVHAYIERDEQAGTQQLIIKSNTGEKVGITGWPDTDYMPTEATVTSLDLSSGDWKPASGYEYISFAVGDNSLPSTDGIDLDSKSDTELAAMSIVKIESTDTAITVAEKINSINGIFSRTSADGKRIVISAERTGDLPADRLHIDEAQESLHYPSLTIKAEGNARAMFDLPKNDNNEYTDDTITARSENRKLDHSHMDVFDVLGMETAMKSREFGMNDTLTVEDGEQLHWRVTSGGRTADIKLNSGTYTLTELAERLKNAGTGWLEVTVSEDVDDDSVPTLDSEKKTQRLVIRGYNGEQVVFLDMNKNHYADVLGLSTALRTDPYTENDIGTGMRCVTFPSAPCVDDNVGIPMRVQMNCGMYYDVNIKKAEVIDEETGFVDRSKVMKSIVEQVNEQEGHDIMGFVRHVDSDGKALGESSAMYFLSGEAFTVVDMPFNDPQWDSYSGGLAAQMGIHGGVTSNLHQTAQEMTDKATFGSEGTIRFSNLSHSVEIDVSAEDTVKDVLDRLRTQAGDWLYVNYYDTHMGPSGRNSGDYPIISLSSVDGSAVNVLDIKGHLAEDALGLSTGVQGRLDDDDGIMAFEWKMATETEAASFPADTMNITVAGYTHTIDLTAMRDVTADDKIKADDLVQFINARMQDYDVQAEISEDNQLMVWSPRGYSVKIGFGERNTDNDTFDYANIETNELNVIIDKKTYTVDLSNAKTADERKEAIITAFNSVKGIKAVADENAKTISFKDDSGAALSAEISYITEKSSDDFLGTGTSARTYYRGGYNLEGDAQTRGIDGNGMYDDGIHTQNATIRSGANTMRQNGFGVINDVIAAVKAGNRDDLADKMLPRIDSFISNILSVMAEDGALQARYQYNTERLVDENGIMTEQYDDLVKIDPAEAISQLMIADYMYQANLAVISRLIQPSLLDFLH